MGFRSDWLMAIAWVSRAAHVRDELRGRREGRGSEVRVGIDVEVVDRHAMTAGARLALARRALLAHLLAVCTPDGGDGALEDGDDSERVARRERRQVDPSVAALAHEVSRESASTTRAMVSRSTSLRFFLAASRSAAVARRSMSRSAPRVASWSMATASEAKSSRSHPMP